MNKAKSFKVNKYKRNGRQPKWRVRGSLFGERIERIFDELGAAKSFAAAKEIERQNGQRQIKATATRLNQTQVFDAEQAIAKLAGKATLTEAINAFLETWVAPDLALSLKETRALYKEKRAGEVKRGDITTKVAYGANATIRRFAKWFGDDKHLSIVTTATFQEFLDHVFTSRKQYENIRGQMSHFFKWARSSGYMKNDPTLGATSFGRRLNKERGVAESMSPPQVAALFARLEKDWPEAIPAFALMTFAGIRPCAHYGEITKIRAKHINLDLGVITMPPPITKTNELRKFKMSPNLVAWLSKYPIEKFPIVCRNFRRLRKIIAEQCHLSKDVLRHSAITYWVALHQSHYKAAKTFGNSEAVIRKHYQDNNRTEDEARQFFEIWPKGSKSEIVPFELAS